MSKDNRNLAVYWVGKVMVSLTKTWREQVKTLKNYIGALYLAMGKRETPWYAKAWIGVVVAYALSPFDLIPDFIPILGYLDDMVLLPLGIYAATRLVPASVLEQCLEEAEGLWAEGKPKNWLAAVVFVLLWVLVLYGVVHWLAAGRL